MDADVQLYLRETNKVLSVVQQVTAWTKADRRPRQKLVVRAKRKKQGDHDEQKRNEDIHHYRGS